MLELSPELGGALQPDPGSHRALCSCHVFFRKRPLSQPQGQRERPEPGLDPALERPFGPRAQGPACQAPSGLFLAFIALPTLPPGKWEQPVARGVGGMSLWDPSSTGSPRTTVSLMTAPHSTPGLRAPPFLACCVSETHRNKAETPGTRLPPASEVGFMPWEGGGQGVGCFFFFYTYETNISNPIPSQAHGHPLTHSPSHAESPA